MILQPYQLASDVMEDTLNNDKTAINNAISHVVMDEEPDFLRQSYLSARFTTPTGLTEVAVADICGVHLIDTSGVIVTEKTGLSGCDIEQLHGITVDLVTSLPLNSYLLEVEKSVDGVASKTKIIRYGGHIMQAVTDGINDIMGTCVDEYIEDCVFKKEPLAVTRRDIACTLLSVSEVVSVRGCNLPNIVTQYNEPVTYKKPSEAMIAIKLEVYNEINKLREGLMAGVSKSARDCLIYNGFSIAFTMVGDRQSVYDIGGVHIENWEGDVVAEHLDITDINIPKLNAIIEDLVSTMPDKGYFVIIESVRQGKNHSVTSRSRVKRNANHLMQGIEFALTYLLDEVYGEVLDSEKSIKDLVIAAGLSGEIITVEANGNIHTVISAKEHKCFDDYALNNII